MKANFKNISTWLLVSLLTPSISFAAGLDKTKTTLDTFKSQLSSIVPPIAIIALIILGIAYATNSVEKSTFVRWAIGIIIAGSASAITYMFWS